MINEGRPRIRIRTEDRPAQPAPPLTQEILIPCAGPAPILIVQMRVTGDSSGGLESFGGGVPPSADLVRAPCHVPFPFIMDLCIPEVGGFSDDYCGWGFLRLEIL